MQLAMGLGDNDIRRADDQFTQKSIFCFQIDWHFIFPNFLKKHKPQRANLSLGIRPLVKELSMGYMFGSSHVM